MRQEVNNFRRLFSALSKLPGIYDKEATISDLVYQYTHHRTSDLKEIHWKEYERMCLDLESKLGTADAKRKYRSVCLKLMQELGIDTTDWQRINAFCQDARICGKLFYRLTEDELKQLQRKLRAIDKKGGLKAEETSSGIRYKIVELSTIEGEKHN